MAAGDVVGIPEALRLQALVETQDRRDGKAMGFSLDSAGKDGRFLVKYCRP